MATIDTNSEVRLRPDFGDSRSDPHYVPHDVEKPRDCYAAEGGSLHSLMRCLFKRNPVTTHKTKLPPQERRRVTRILLTSLQTQLLTIEEQETLRRTIEFVRLKNVSIDDELSIRREAIRTLRSVVSPEHFVAYMAGFLLSPRGWDYSAPAFMGRIILNEVASVCRELGPRARFALPLLAQTIDYHPRGYRLATFRALEYIGGEAIPLLLKWIKAYKPLEYNRVAVRTLHVIGVRGLMGLPPEKILALWEKHLFILSREPNTVDWNFVDFYEWKFRKSPSS